MGKAYWPKELGTQYPEPNRVGIMPAYGIFARHVKNLEMANVSMGFETNDFRPAIACSDVKGLEIDNFRAQLADGVSPSKFEKVSGLVIRRSQNPGRFD
jgi:hypothetical protein